MRRAVESPHRVRSNALADPHHLADTDPQWAGGDALRLRRLASVVTPSVVQPVLGLLGIVPGPRRRCGPHRTGHLIGLVPKGSPA